jgi:ABC-2 type transport system permease protein
MERADKPTDHAIAFSRRRVFALVLRYLYLLKGSWPRILELAYWPSVQIILWGFISKHFLTQSSWLAEAAGALLAAVLLWDILFRGQLGYSISFLEELWSRNLGQLFVSPLRPYELVAALTTISMVRTLIGVVPAAVLAIPLYGFSVFDLGLPLLAFFLNLLVTGWALGLFVTALLIRVGLGAESVCWMALFLIAPVSAIYYPVDVLPEWLQWVAWSLPPAYVFEGMRAILFDGVFRPDLLYGAAALNLLYFSMGAATFLLAFRVARRRGLLYQTGE